MGSCRHNLGAHNSVHFMQSLGRAYLTHNLCTKWHHFPSLTSVHTDCTHLQQHIGLSQWAWMNPILLCFHNKIWHTPRENFRVHSESHLPLSGQQYSHKQLVRLCGNYLLGWYCQNFILWACANHSQFTALLQNRNNWCVAFVCLFSVEISMNETAHGLLFYIN